jgi:hypothetical protein
MGHDLGGIGHFANLRLHPQGGYRLADHGLKFLGKSLPFFLLHIHVTQNVYFEVARCYKLIP